MKTLSRLLLPLLLATASAIVSSCGEDDKQDDPTPKSHTVEVRLSGNNLSGLGAVASGGSTNPEGTDAQQTFRITPLTTAGSYTFSQPVGAVSASREFTTTISFENVRGAQRAPAGSFFAAEIVVDGVVKKTLRLDNTTAPGVVYVTARTSIVRSEW